jgi:hypothetical protein
LTHSCLVLRSMPTMVVMYHAINCLNTAAWQPLVQLINETTRTCFIFRLLAYLFNVTVPIAEVIESEETWRWPRMIHWESFDRIQSWHTIQDIMVIQPWQPGTSWIQDTAKLHLRPCARLLSSLHKTRFDVASCSCRNKIKELHERVWDQWLFVHCRISANTGWWIYCSP